MPDFTLWNKIRSARPSITDSSINAYVSNIEKVQNGLNITDHNSVDFLNDFERVMGFIEDLDKQTTRRNIIASIVVVMKSLGMDSEIIEQYSKVLKSNNSEILVDLKKQKKSESQKEKWIEYEDIVHIANELLAKVNNFRKNNVLSKQQWDELEDLVILRSYLVAPSRNVYATMDVIDSDDYEQLDKDKNNYLVVEDGVPLSFILNSYKNSKHLGRKIIKIPEDTAKIIKLWLKHNKSGHFLLNSRGVVMTTNGLTKRLQKIFEQYIGKKISSSMIRHIMASYDLRDEPTILEKENENDDIETKYQHSKFMHELYRKVD